MFLKQIFAREAKLRGQICYPSGYFPRDGHYGLIVGSLGNDNGDGDENVISKYKFALF